MTITEEGELVALQAIGGIVARTLRLMISSVEIGMTTAELDEIGRRFMTREGARSAPQFCYDFPGATCISINEEVAHGIPGPRQIKAGDLVNIDVSAEKDGFFGDTGASFVVGAGKQILDQLLRDGKKAMEIGIAEVSADRPLAGIGRAVQHFADQRGYTLIHNLASHGIGRKLHEEPEAIPTWAERREKRRIAKGQVMTIEPFLSTGATWADQGEDGWTLYSAPQAPVVQFEHTIVATSGAPIILTLPQ